MVGGFGAICFTTLRRMGNINSMPGRLSSTHFMCVYVCRVSIAGDLACDGWGFSVGWLEPQKAQWLVVKRDVLYKTTLMCFALKESKCVFALIQKDTGLCHL